MPRKILVVLCLIQVRELPQHSTIVGCIVTCDVANLGIDISRVVQGVKILLTLCATPTRSSTLNNAPPRRWPLWALLSLVKPSNAFPETHCIGSFSSIQWPVTAKYPSELLACHASHVTLMAPLTDWP